ncbi:MAG: FAD-dependent oxidoreductase [candidate division Zixibacteria bacterium]|nr:FAD-dependent oxidoreductase [candidate division Zixibacteria bacterium]
MVKKVKKKKKGLRSLRSSGGSAVETSSLRPKFVPKKSPCGSVGCPNHNHIRKALMAVSRAEEFGKDVDEQIKEAFYTFLETTPFPSVCGRVCPHPCETECNRNEKEGALGINSFERFLGDYGLENKLAPIMLTEKKRSEKIAIIGSGPGGMSCAYQLARRGYPVTVFEAFPKTGGMLRYGIPDYRLPQNILDAEIKRIQDMGVEIKTNTTVGKDIPYEDLQKEYKAIFVALGAHKGKNLRIEGEDAPNVFTGTDFLHRVNAGESVEVGDNVVVIGGGDTAIDAARIARRLGANATILYRRTRKEMPAIDEEIDGAEKEGVRIDLLAAPIEIYTKDGKAIGMKCQKMELGEPDDSGRRRPMPIEGDTYDLEFSALIAAISQEPDFNGFGSLIEGKDWIKVDDKFKTKIDATYSGGDNINLGLAIDAIFHGRMAAGRIHEMLSGEAVPVMPKMDTIRMDKMAHGYYEEKQRTPIKEIAVEDALKSLTAEITSTWSKDEAVGESMRCMSCGMCFDCGTCWSFCQDNAIIKPLIRGEEYKFKMEFCNGCKKCAENCPCGYIEMH